MKNLFLSLFTSVFFGFYYMFLSKPLLDYLNWSPELFAFVLFLTCILTILVIVGTNLASKKTKIIYNSSSDILGFLFFFFVGFYIFMLQKYLGNSSLLFSQEFLTIQKISTSLVMSLFLYLMLSKYERKTKSHSQKDTNFLSQS